MLYYRGLKKYVLTTIKMTSTVKVVIVQVIVNKIKRHIVVHQL